MVYDYNDEEWNHVVPRDPDWQRPETDYLMGLCQRLDLRFLVIADRYDVRPRRTCGSGRGRVGAGVETACSMAARRTRHSAPRPLPARRPGAAGAARGPRGAGVVREEPGGVLAVAEPGRPRAAGAVPGRQAAQLRGPQGALLRDRARAAHRARGLRGDHCQLDAGQAPFQRAARAVRSAPRPPLARPSPLLSWGARSARAVAEASTACTA